MSKVVLYVGPPGCGKTYKAIAEAQSFAIAVPCRQLAYEIYWDFPHRISRIDTGELHFGDPKGNEVCVYENLPEGPISQETLIVDEAHGLNDLDRGGALFEKVLANKAAGKRVVLLTATDTLSDEVKVELQVREVQLSPFVTAPLKVQLNFEQFCNKVKAGMRTIVFTKFTPSDSDLYHYAQSFDIPESHLEILSANTPSFERVETQLRFKAGKLPVIIATNVLAQGLNFPAEGVLIEYNEYDDWEVVSQKIGRVARPLSGLSEGYYCLSLMPQKDKKQGLPKKAERQATTYLRPSGKAVSVASWGFVEHEVPRNLHHYKYYKYSYRFLQELLVREGLLEPREIEALQFLGEQSQRLVKLLMERPGS